MNINSLSIFEIRKFILLIFDLFSHNSFHVLLKFVYTPKSLT